MGLSFKISVENGENIDNRLTLTNLKCKILISNFKKKLVTRLPNFPDRRIKYEFFKRNIVTNEKINFWNFINFFKENYLAIK